MDENEDELMQLGELLLKLNQMQIELERIYFDTLTIPVKDLSDPIHRIS